jgi:asparagine synthase (glutamine-hydrolysing)
MGTEAMELLEALRAAVGPLEGKGDVAVAFSGGLDSSVVARLISEVAGVHLYVAGVGGSHDVRQATAAARSIGLPLDVLSMDASWVRERLALLVGLFGPSPAVVPFEVPLLAVAEGCREKILATGQGADELFGGYHRYVGLGPGPLERALDADLEKLLLWGHPREEALVASRGRELLSPYLHPEVVEWARGQGVGLKVAGGERKVVLRAAASLLGLPETLVGRPKKAAQYGSGSLALLRSLAKEEGLRPGEYLSRFERP